MVVAPKTLPGAPEPHGPTTNSISSHTDPARKKIGNPIVKKAQQHISHSQFCSKLRVFLNLPCVKRRNSRKHILPPSTLVQMYKAIEHACKTYVLESFDKLTVSDVYTFFRQLSPQNTKFKTNVRMTELYTALTGRPAPSVTAEELNLILQVRELFDLKTRVILKREARNSRLLRRKRPYASLDARNNTSAVFECPNTKTITKFNWILQALAVTSFLGMTHLTRHLPSLGEKLRSQHAVICRQVLEEIRDELHLKIRPPFQKTDV